MVNGRRFNYRRTNLGPNFRLRRGFLFSFQIKDLTKKGRKKEEGSNPRKGNNNWANNGLFPGKGSHNPSKGQGRKNSLIRKVNLPNSLN